MTASRILKQGRGWATRLHGKTPPALQRKLLLLAALVVLYTGVFVAAEGLRFPIGRDEVHFWPTSQSFSHRFLPTLQQLREYNELNTPFPFLVFGWVERLFHAGIVGGRFVNFCLSFMIALLVGFGRGSKPGEALLALSGLFLFPYFFGLSTHLYTDVIAGFFGLVGLASYLRRSFSLSALAFILAVASRQYMLAIPLALLVYEILESGRPAFRVRQLALALSSATILFWIWLFQGPAPPRALEGQDIVPAAFSPSNGLYFLTCLGAYYVLPEILLFREKIEVPWKNVRVLALATSVTALFILCPPLRNDNFAIETMGYLDKAARLVLRFDFLRLILFYALALATVVRFSSFRLSSAVVYANMLILMKAHVAWDKYAFPALLVLWYLRAITHEHGLSPSAEPESTIPSQAATD